MMNNGSKVLCINVDGGSLARNNGSTGLFIHSGQYYLINDKDDQSWFMMVSTRSTLKLWLIVVDQPGKMVVLANLWPILLHQ